MGKTRWRRRRERERLRESNAGETGTVITVEKEDTKMAKRPDPTVGWEWVTREQAFEMLKHVPESQRALGIGNAENYARDILADNWWTDVPEVSFDWNGELLNGQHVLNGLILSKRPKLKIKIGRNYDPKSYMGFDKGRKRTAANDLKFLGMDHYNDKAGMGRVYWQWSTGKFEGSLTNRSSSAFPTASEVVQIVTDHPGFGDHLFKNPFGGKHRDFSMSALRLGSYVICGVDRPRGEKFFKMVLTGDEIPAVEQPQYHPVKLLRNTLLNLGKDQRLRNGETLACVFKAFNAFYKGETLRAPLLRKGEDFPKLWTGADLKEIKKKGA